MFRDEFKNREEFLAAHKESVDLSRMEDAGVMPTAEANRKIYKIKRAALIHQNCLTQSKQKRNIDCTESYQFLMDQIGAAKAAGFNKVQRLKAAAQYLSDAEKHGDLPMLAKARETIEVLEDKAASGEVRPQKMFEDVRSIKKKMMEFESCFLWAKSAKFQHEQLRREAQCVAKTSNDLENVLKKFK